MKMENTSMEFVTFDAQDVIATSGPGYDTALSFITTKNIAATYNAAHDGYDLAFSEEDELYMFYGVNSIQDTYNSEVDGNIITSMANAPEKWILETESQLQLYPKGLIYTEDQDFIFAWINANFGRPEQ